MTKTRKDEVDTIKNDAELLVPVMVYECRRKRYYTDHHQKKNIEPTAYPVRFYDKVMVKV